MTNPSAERTSCRAPHALWVCGLCVSLVGCQMMDAVKSPFRGDEPQASIDDVRGPMERFLHTRPDQRDEATRQADIKAQAKLRRGEDLFKSGEYDKAEDIFKELAKKPTSSVVGARAQFMIAECQFAQKRYAKAQDSYDKLIEDYPSTRDLDTASRRLFEIAKAWLGIENVATTDEIQRVAFDEDGAVVSDVVKEKSGGSLSLLPNLIDRSRPVFDTPGRALQALETIYMKDPSGPLADDALMLTATYYFRKGDHRQADRYFDMFREQYPKSAYLEKAFLLGSHVKLMSYQGAGYDGQKLDEARRLKESAVKLFPNSESKEHLKQELARIEEIEAQRDWERARYWGKKKGNPDAAAVYYRSIIESYPHTRYAMMSRKALAEISDELDQPYRPSNAPRDSVAGDDKRWLPELKVPSLKPPNLLPFLRGYNDHESPESAPKIEPLPLNPDEVDETAPGRARL